MRELLRLTAAASSLVFLLPGLMLLALCSFIMGHGYERAYKIMAEEFSEAVTRARLRIETTDDYK